MLHGYAQNGDTFQRKLRNLEQTLRSAFPTVELTYPNGPIPLQTSDIPGHEPTRNNNGDLQDLNLRAWFHLRGSQHPPAGLHESLIELAEILQRNGPFDGVVAFSQGTVLAAVLASLLQGRERREAYERASRASFNIMAFPESFVDLQHPPLKFVIAYAGRVGRASCYDWLYSGPSIDTPFCHFVGALDPMVEHEERDAVLARLSGSNRTEVVVHAGGHCAPVDRESVARAVRFISRCSGGTSTVSTASTATAPKEPVEPAVPRDFLEAGPALLARRICWRGGGQGALRDSVL